MATPVVSVVVPVLEEEREITAVLDHLADVGGGAFDVVVVDGGSRDRTVALARAHPSRPRVLEHVAGGRAGQQNAGAAAARGELLVFLHADSRLPASAPASFAGLLADPGAEGGAFALRFDGGDRFSRVLGAWYAVQRRAGVLYGDATLVVRRGAFADLGGFRPLAIMEDYDLARRLWRRGRTRTLPGPATTSARRWRALGVPRTVASWVVIRWLWIAGVPADRLAALYRRAR